MSLSVKYQSNDHDLLGGISCFSEPVSRITGIGSNLPETILTNADLVERISVPPRLKKSLPGIIERTAQMKTRRSALSFVSPSDLGVPAVLEALGSAGRKPEEVDTLIYASTDTDQLEPATANVLQRKLGIKQVNAFDVSNACNSFLQAVNVGNSLIATGAARCVAICSSELGTQWICNELSGKEELRYKMGALTLGDAAASVILEPSDGISGITEINLFSLGEYWPLCHVPEDTEWRKKMPHNIHGWFYLDMPELARVVRPLTVRYYKQYREYRETVHGETDFTQHFDQIIPHQISKRLIAEIVKIIKTDPEKVAVTAEEFGNTAAAAIPFTLHQTIKQGKLSLGSGQDVLFFGAASGLGMGHIRLKL